MLQLRHSASLFGPLLRPCGSGSSWQRWLSVRSLWPASCSRSRCRTRMRPHREASSGRLLRPPGP